MSEEKTILTEETVSDSSATADVQTDEGQESPQSDKKEKKTKKTDKTEPAEKPVKQKPQKTEGGYTNTGVGYRCNYSPDKKAEYGKKRAKKKELGVGKWTASKIIIAVFCGLIAVGLIAAVVVALG